MAHYTALLDGYNIIHQHATWTGLSLEAGRNRVVEAVGRLRWPVPVQRVILVFGGQENSSTRPTARIGIQYAWPSADAYIREAVRRSADSRQLIVISDDREIIHTAKSHGAVCYPVAWMLRRAGEGAAVARRKLDSPRPVGTQKDDKDKDDDEKRAPPASVARTITEELAKRWLQGSH